MRNLLALIVGATLMLAAAPILAAARPSQQEIDKRAAEIGEFVRLVTGYKVTARPKIVFRSQETLDRIYFGDDYKPSLSGFTAALAIGGVIMLNDRFELGRDDYILAHEITHFMQHESGVDDKGCAGNLEPEAYRVQDIFVAATGRGVRSDPFTVLAIAAACSGM